MSSYVFCELTPKDFMIFSNILNGIKIINFVIVCC